MKGQISDHPYLSILFFLLTIWNATPISCFSFIACLKEDYSELQINHWADESVDLFPAPTDVAIFASELSLADSSVSTSAQALPKDPDAEQTPSFPDPTSDATTTTKSVEPTTPTLGSIREEESSHNRENIRPRSSTNSTSGNSSFCHRISKSVKAQVNLALHLQAILHNTIAMTYFQEFCIEKFLVEYLLFWIDVEVFRSGYHSSDSLTALVQARYIYLTYIAKDGPLAINVPSELRRSVQWPMQPGKKPEELVFDDCQGHVYGILYKYATPMFMMSSYYQSCYADRMQGNNSTEML